MHDDTAGPACRSRGTTHIGRACDVTFCDVTFLFHGFLKSNELNFADRSFKWVSMLFFPGNIQDGRQQSDFHSRFAQNWSDGFVMQERFISTATTPLAVIKLSALSLSFFPSFINKNISDSSTHTYHAMSCNLLMWRKCFHCCFAKYAFAWNATFCEYKASPSSFVSFKGSLHQSRPAFVTAKKKLFLFWNTKTRYKRYGLEFGKVDMNWNLSKYPRYLYLTQVVHIYQVVSIVLVPGRQGVWW